MNDRFSNFDTDTTGGHTNREIFDRVPLKPSCAHTDEKSTTLLLSFSMFSKVSPSPKDFLPVSI